MYLHIYIKIAIDSFDTYYTQYIWLRNYIIYVRIFFVITVNYIKISFHKLNQILLFFYISVDIFRPTHVIQIHFVYISQISVKCRILLIVSQIIEHNYTIVKTLFVRYLILIYVADIFAPHTCVHLQKPATRFCIEINYPERRANVVESQKIQNNSFTFTKSTYQTAVMYIEWSIQKKWIHYLFLCSELEDERISCRVGNVNSPLWVKYI